MKGIQDSAQKARLKCIPGSEDDMDFYLKARAIDELFNLFDTIDERVHIHELNMAQAR